MLAALLSLGSQGRRLTHWAAAAPGWTSRHRSRPTSGAAADTRIPRIRQREEWPRARSSASKINEKKTTLFADKAYSNSLPLARDIGHLLLNQMDDAVDDGVKDLFDLAPVEPSA